MLFLGLLETVQSTWGPLVMVKFYMDDRTIATCGLPGNVVAVMVEVLDFVIFHLERVLLMEVSARKSKLVGGRKAVAVAILTRLQTQKVGLASSGRMLGTDAAGGRRRGTKVASARHSAFRASVYRFQVLRKLGVNTRIMAQAVGAPSVLSVEQLLVGAPCA